MNNVNLKLLKIKEHALAALDQDAQKERGKLEQEISVLKQAAEIEADMADEFNAGAKRNRRVAPGTPGGDRRTPVC